MRRSREFDRAGDGVEVRWARGDAVLVVSVLVALVGMSVVGLGETAARGQPVRAIAWTCALLPLALFAWRAWGFLRAPPARISNNPTGGLLLRHPMLRHPMTITAEQVHSVWIGPYRRPEPDPRDRWTGRRGFPVAVADISGYLRPQRDGIQRLVIVFRDPLSLRQEFRVPRLLWAVITRNSWLPGRAVNGLAANVGVERANLPTHIGEWPIRRGMDMPDDVWAWLA